MRSSWICCAGGDRRRGPTCRCVRRSGAGLLILALLASAAGPAGAAGTKRKLWEQSVEELVHPFLSPRYSRWLVGPLGFIAAEREIEAYLALPDDQAAARFIEEFWKQRDPDPDFPGNPVRDLYDARVEEADRLYREGVRPGSDTVRGIIYVLYGPPEEERFDYPSRRGGAPIEVWSYPKDAPAGLDGQSPDRVYRFTRQGDRIVLYNAAAPRRRPPI